MASQAMILAVRDVCAGYGTAPVLRNISFTQQHGEVLGIVGHNGMGKTTLLRTIVGLPQTASGAIEFDGEPIEDTPAYRRSSAGIGYVPQGNLGFPDLSVAENLELVQAMKGRCSHLTIEAVVSLFPRLAELLDRRSAALSGGERQLLSIARAVIRSPRLLLLDEMTEGIQPSIVEEIAERLRNLHDQLGMTMLIVDQELAFVATLASRVLVMQKGQIAQDLASDKLSESQILGAFGVA
jgi:ABC-type branched-subunit amino acid transport system ATPase component